MKINILGIKIDALTYQQTLEKIESFVNSPSQHYLVSANPEVVLKAFKNPSYREMVNRASLVTPDGIGLLWAAKFLSLKSPNFFISLIQVIISSISLVLNPRYCRAVLPERVTGVDLLEKICEQAAKKDWKIYLLGGEEGIADSATQVLQKKYVNLSIVGAKGGPSFKIRNSKLEIRNNIQNLNFKFQNIISDINNKNPDILFVAFGAPKQEFWIAEFLPKMPAVKLAVGVGGALDFISGKAKRAPKIYQNLGLEWLFRLINEPWRAVRIFNATIKFVYNVVKFKHDTNDTN